jgi:26S proteasome regulatory subunit T1
MNTDKKENLKKEEKKEDKIVEEGKSKPKPVDEADIDLLKRYGRGPYSEKIKGIEEEVKTYTKTINKLCGIRESDTGLALPTNWVIEVFISVIIL